MQNGKVLCTSTLAWNIWNKVLYLKDLIETSNMQFYKRHCIMTWYSCYSIRIHIRNGLLFVLQRAIRIKIKTISIWICLIFLVGVNNLCRVEPYCALCDKNLWSLFTIHSHPQIHAYTFGIIHSSKETN